MVEIEIDRYRGGEEGGGDTDSDRKAMKAVERQDRSRAGMGDKSKDGKFK